jgi:hypothetical protein
MLLIFLGWRYIVLFIFLNNNFKKAKPAFLKSTNGILQTFFAMQIKNETLPLCLRAFVANPIIAKQKPLPALNVKNRIAEKSVKLFKEHLLVFLAKKNCEANQKRRFSFVPLRLCG